MTRYPSSVGYAVSRAAVHQGVRLLVLLQKPDLPPEEHDRRGHDDEYLEENPDIDAREDAIERDDVGVGKPKPHRLVRDSGSQEQRCIAGKVVPAFLRKMERLVKHEAEKFLSAHRPIHRRKAT